MDNNYSSETKTREVVNSKQLNSSYLNRSYNSNKEHHIYNSNRYNGSSLQDNKSIRNISDKAKLNKDKSLYDNTSSDKFKNASRDLPSSNLSPLSNDENNLSNTNSSFSSNKNISNGNDISSNKNILNGNDISSNKNISNGNDIFSNKNISNGNGISSNNNLSNGNDNSFNNDNFGHKDIPDDKEMNVSLNNKNDGSDDNSNSNSPTNKNNSNSLLNNNGDNNKLKNLDNKGIGGNLQDQLKQKSVEKALSAYNPVLGALAKTKAGKRVINDLTKNKKFNRGVFGGPITPISTDSNGDKVDQDGKNIEEKNEEKRVAEGHVTFTKKQKRMILFGAISAGFNIMIAICIIFVAVQGLKTVFGDDIAKTIITDPDASDKLFGGEDKLGEDGVDNNITDLDADGNSSSTSSGSN